MAHESVPEQPRSSKILRLPETVVNRIAAGEIIQRPASALKEMLENSLDAGATQVNITVKEGGNKLLQIQDNGTGIHVDDLALLCERHATSKLKTFEDLEGISTLGFRGEALASISFVGHLSVTTMTEGSPHGYKVTYRDGIMDPLGPKPCAANKGTTITVEDLFYNVPTRKKALKSSSDEFARILDVVGCYAIFKPEVGFSVKKQGEARADLHSLPGARRADNIRNIHGGAVARHVLEFSASAGKFTQKAAPSEDVGMTEMSEDTHAADSLHYDAQGFISNGDYSGKKTVLILFINGRPVDCAPLKRALEITYCSILPKAAKPWMFLDLRLPGDHVDVNLHPTKKEVGFLHQDQLIESICSAVESKLSMSNTQRTFVQTQLPVSMRQNKELETQGSDPIASSVREKAVADNKLIRTDSRARTLDSYMRPSQSSPRHPLQESPGAENAQLPGGFAASAVASRRRGPDRGTVRLRDQWEAEERSKLQDQKRSVRQKPNPVASELESIQELLLEIETNTHSGLSELIKSHTFVGMADPTLALLQHGTRLYLVDTTKVTEELFYQQAVARFEQFNAIKLSHTPRARELALLALQSELHDPGGGNVSSEEVADLIEKLLIQKAEMLHECFGVGLNDSGHICSLPQLIEGYVPDLDYLPSFVMTLAREVNWNEEKPCFCGVAKALAEFYSWKPSLDAEDNAPEASLEQPGCSTGAADIKSPGVAAETGQADSQQERSWTIEHVLFPALRAFWKPSQDRAQDGSMLELTRLEHLYRIFERC